MLPLSSCYWKSCCLQAQSAYMFARGSESRALQIARNSLKRLHVYVAVAACLLWFAPELCLRQQAGTPSTAAGSQSTDKAVASGQNTSDEKAKDSCCKTISTPTSTSTFAPASAAYAANKACCGAPAKTPVTPPPATLTTEVYRKGFPSRLDPKAFVAQFKGVLNAKAKDIEQVGLERVLFLLDSTIKTKRKDDSEFDDGVRQIKQVIDQVAANCPKNSVEYRVYPERQQMPPSGLRHFRAALAPTATNRVSTPLYKDLYWAAPVEEWKPLHRVEMISPELMKEVLYHRNEMEHLGEEQTEGGGNVTACPDLQRWAA